jgi:hypothetical protein
VILTREVKNIPEGERVKLSIYEYDDGNEHGYTGAVKGTVRNGWVEAAWKAERHADDGDTNSTREMKEKDYTLPDEDKKYHAV